jgi:hypothetical protein
MVFIGNGEVTRKPSKEKNTIKAIIGKIQAPEN